MGLMHELDAAIERRHLLTHPFYRKWVDGTLPVEALHDYASQYHTFESTLPRYLSTLHGRCADPAVRQTLLSNLWDEESGAENHVELWLRFAEGVGVDRQAVRDAPANAATATLVDTYWDAVRDRPVAAGVAAIYAYERQVPDVARAKIAGLRDHFDVTDPRALRFFTVHAGLDVAHSDAERAAIERLADGDDEEDVVSAASSALDAWWGFLDAVDPV